jgi:hypothetical protein
MTGQNPTRPKVLKVQRQEIIWADPLTLFLLDIVQHQSHGGIKKGTTPLQVHRVHYVAIQRNAAILAKSIKNS